MLIGRWSLIAVGLLVGIVACAGPRLESTTGADEPATAPSAPATSGADSSSTAAVAPPASSTLPPTTSTPSNPSTPSTPPDSSSPESPQSSQPATSATAEEQPPVVEPIAIRLRLDRRVDDPATEGFENLVQSVLTDQRGWQQAGFVFSFSNTEFDYTVVLAEGPEVDSLCLPYDTFGRFSCQIGPIVALNADRWREAVDRWPASLDEYRTMLVNHEVGHLLGQHHPAERCPGPGQPAPVMAQQSSGVDPCVANPWPRPWEIVCARQGVEPLAPPYERDIVLTCGPDGPIGT